MVMKKPRTDCDLTCVVYRVVAGGVFVQGCRHLVAWISEAWNFSTKSLLALLRKHRRSEAKNHNLAANQATESRILAIPAAGHSSRTARNLESC